MKTLELGTCCVDCFNAVNHTHKELQPDAAEYAKEACIKLSELAEKEGVQSLHTGDYEGFSSFGCSGCGSPLGGDRWQLSGLAVRKDN